MRHSFSTWLAIHEVFNLVQGRVLSLVELFDPQTIAKQQISQVASQYRPNPLGDDHLTAAVVGLKPCAIVRYDHHPDNPAAAIVTDELKKHPTDAGAVQAELLKHGVKVRPDFHIIHMNLPGYSTAEIIVGGKQACEELWELYKCQYYLDFISSDDHSQVTPETIQKVNDMMHGRCQVFCKYGRGGINCKPIHKRIGQLLGYTEKQVDEFLGQMDQMGGYSHMPDVHYPFKLPSSLQSLPRRKGFQN